MGTKLYGNTMTEIQRLLDEEAKLGNEGRRNSPDRMAVLRKIIELRGTQVPHCHGHDDCSTMVLVRCPWRIDCGPEFP
jgi:hypothetical protein